MDFTCLNVYILDKYVTALLDVYVCTCVCLCVSMRGLYSVGDLLAAHIPHQKGYDSLIKQNAITCKY